MSANRYGKILTIILIVLIVAILIGVGILGFNYIKMQNKETNAKEAIDEFDRNVGQQVIDDGQSEEQDETNKKLEVESTDHSQEQITTQTRKKVYTEDGYIMLGYITIPKTDVKYPILDSVTPEALETAVAALYPSNAQLNQPGNVVIIGHNYKNGRFFSNNKKLTVGDKVRIKDNTGTELTYTIYEKFETTPEDTSFYARNTNGAIEITLSTCTDDSKARTIILARVEQ